MSPLQPQPPGVAVPRPSLHARPYWEGCRRHELLYQRCSVCGYRGLRAFTVCASCSATSPVWERSAGVGSLYSWTVVWRPPEPTLTVPYAPAVVHLDEGVWMMSAVIGCEIADLHGGLRLAVVFHPASDDVILPYFAPAADGAGAPSGGGA
ncbi:MAG: Zn-ribbon domain-containing OB-fold protein [Acidimicrobiales bacterium]